jgi:hypothetical protein
MVLTNLQRQNMPYCKLCADRFRRYVVDCGREKRRRPMAQRKYRRNVTEPVPPCYRRCIRCEILNYPRSVGFSGGLLLKRIGLHLHIKGQIKIPCLSYGAAVTTQSIAYSLQHDTATLISQSQLVIRFCQIFSV